MTTFLKRLFVAFVAIGFLACTPSSQEESGDNLRIEFEKYTLENGLDVILHQDKYTYFHFAHKTQS